LFVLIVMFSKVSGAHFNPVVTLVDAIGGGTNAGEGMLYTVAQITGALLGTGVANLMFELPIFFASGKVRTGGAQWLGEFVATFGLVAVIIAIARQYKSTTIIAGTVACYITAAYWFTSSTSFANPAVTIARSLSDTFTGIRPIDAPGFIGAQVLGGVGAILLFRWLVPQEDV